MVRITIFHSTFYTEASTVDGILRGKFMVSLHCLAICGKRYHLADNVQSKDKFLSAVSSDGFGFCSVVLYASPAYCPLGVFNYMSFTAAGICMIKCIQRNYSFRTEPTGTVTSLHQ